MPIPATRRLEYSCEDWAALYDRCCGSITVRLPGPTLLWIWILLYQWLVGLEVREDQWKSD
jgi:hypothetical protein